MKKGCLEVQKIILNDEKQLVGRIKTLTWGGKAAMSSSSHKKNLLKLHIS
jgi:hypothetical protein